MVNFNLLLQNIIGDESKKKKFVGGIVALWMSLQSFVLILVPEGNFKIILLSIGAVGQLTIFIWLVSKKIKDKFKKQNRKNK